MQKSSPDWGARDCLHGPLEERPRSGRSTSPEAEPDMRTYVRPGSDRDGMCGENGCRTQITINDQVSWNRRGDGVHESPPNSRNEALGPCTSGSRLFPFWWQLQNSGSVRRARRPSSGKSDQVQEELKTKKVVLVEIIEGNRGNLGNLRTSESRDA